MHLPSVKVVQESVLIRPPSLLCAEASGCRQGGGRRLAGSLSTLLLHSGLQSGLATAVTTALYSLDTALTARAEAGCCRPEGSADAVGFIKSGSFNLSTPLCLYSCSPACLCISYSLLKTCLFTFNLAHSDLAAHTTIDLSSPCVLSTDVFICQRFILFFFNLAQFSLPPHATSPFIAYFFIPTLSCLCLCCMFLCSSMSLF